MFLMIQVVIQLNKFEKETAKAQLSDEEKALNELKSAYKKARKDVKEQISALDARTDMENLQSIIYQKKYQEALLKQIDGALDDLNSGQYKTTQEFFEGSYANGYVGSMYELQKQGIPITVPIDQKKMVTAIKTDSKLSKSYYQNRNYPENISRLKKSIRTEVSRGIASGKTWKEVAWQVAEGMNSPFNRAMNDAIRIIRTEGNRINQQGRLDSGDEAVSRGCDLLKQWDATMDSVTRPWHMEADGQIVEWNDFFIVDGEKMKAPSVGGSARNVCNCRCQLLKRPRWALDEAELEELKKRASFFGLDKSSSFDDYKQKYLNLPSNADTIKVDKNIFPDSIAGVNRGEPMSHKDADSGAVNPNYRKSVGHNGYRINCQSCVPTYEARRRGYDVEVLANYNNPTAKEISYNTNKAWIDPNTGKTPPIKRSGVKTAKQLLNYVKENTKEGERYSFQFYWKNYNSGHIVTMYKENGEVIMYDPQPDTVTKGDENLLYYFKQIQFRNHGTDCSPNLLRIDNLEFDSNRANGIMKKKGS